MNEWKDVIVVYHQKLYLQIKNLQITEHQKLLWTFYNNILNTVKGLEHFHLQRVPLFEYP